VSDMKSNHTVPRYADEAAFPRADMSSFVEERATSKRSNPCHRCGEQLAEETAVPLEYSATSDLYYAPGKMPINHESLGTYFFGPTCAKRVLKAKGELDKEYRG